MQTLYTLFNVVSSSFKNENTLSDTDAHQEEAFKDVFHSVIGSAIPRFPCSGSGSAHLSTWESAWCVYDAQSRAENECERQCAGSSTSTLQSRMGGDPPPTRPLATDALPPLGSVGHQHPLFVARTFRPQHGFPLYRSSLPLCLLTGSCMCVLGHRGDTPPPSPTHTPIKPLIHPFH